MSISIEQRAHDLAISQIHAFQVEQNESNEPISAEDAYVYLYDMYLQRLASRLKK